MIVDIRTFPARLDGTRPFSTLIAVRHVAYVIADPGGEDEWLPHMIAVPRSGTARARGG